MKMGDFDVCNTKNPMNITIKGKMQIFVVRTYKLDKNEGKSFLRRGQAKVLFKTGALL
jgi:hypothetical protein